MLRSVACLLLAGIAACVAPALGQEIPLTQPVSVSGQEQYRYTSVVTGAAGQATGMAWCASQPQHLFVRGDGGVWKLDRAARRWQCLTDNLPFAWRDLAAVDSIAVHPANPEIIYIACGSRWGVLHDVLKTDDGGKHWRRLNVTNAAGRPVVSDGKGENVQAGERLVIDPSSPNIIYFATRNDGLLVSRDAGETWSAIASLPSKGKQWAGLTFVALQSGGGKSGQASKRLVVGVTPDRAKRVMGGVYISSDAGASWVRVEDGPAVEHWTAVPMRARIADDGTIYLTTVGGIWKLPGGTGLWRNITPSDAKGRTFCAINLNPTDSAKIVVAEMGSQAEASFYYSANGGENWRQYRYQQGDPDHRSVKVAGYPAWQLAEGSLQWGVDTADLAFDSVDPAVLWHASGSGVCRLVGVGGDEVTATLLAEGREQSSCADLVSPTSGAPLISGMWNSGGFRYERTDETPTQRIRRQQPDGSLHREMWRRSYQDIFDIDVQPANPDDLVAAGGWQWSQSGEASYSVDNGRTFRAFASEPFPGAKFGRIAIGVEPGNIVWAPKGQATSAVYCTRDNGATWLQSQGAPIGLIATEGILSFYRCLAADRARPGVFYIFDRRDGRFYRSTDGGARFDELATLPKQQGVHLDWHRLEAAPGHEGDVWLALREGGLLRSTDGGKTWVKFAAIQWAENFAFGKPRDEGKYPAIYLFGQIGGEKPVSTTVECRLYRSDDEGRTWVQINDQTMQFATISSGMAGDMQTYGRVYIGTTGRGVFRGEPAESRK